MDLELEGLVALRRHRDLTQGQAAELLTQAGHDTPRATWQKLEQKRRPMTLDRLGQIREAFELAPDEITAITTWWWKPTAA